MSDEYDVICKEIEAAKRKREYDCVHSFPPGAEKVIFFNILLLSVFLILDFFNCFDGRGESHRVVKAHSCFHDDYNEGCGNETGNGNCGCDGFTYCCLVVTNERCCTNKQGVGGE